MSSSSRVKSPTLVSSLPTLVLPPFVLIRTWSRSGNRTAERVRVQNENCAPFFSVSTGVSSQLLIVPTLSVFAKSAAMYESAEPAWALNTEVSPWNQSVAPGGLLLFCLNQPGRLETSLKPWLRPHVETAVEAEAEPAPTLLVALAVLT